MASDDLGTDADHHGQRGHEGRTIERIGHGRRVSKADGVRRQSRTKAVRRPTVAFLRTQLGAERHTPRYRTVGSEKGLAIRFRLVVRRYYQLIDEGRVAEWGSEL